MLIGTQLGLLSIPLFLIFHVAAYRLISSVRKMSRQKIVVLVVLVSAIVSTALTLHLSGDVTEAVHTFVLSGLYGMIYFHWFNMSETARRIRILVRFVALNESPAVESAQESSSRIFANRIDRMSQMGTIIDQNGKFHLKPGPLLYATRIILFWRSLFFPAR